MASAPCDTAGAETLTQHSIGSQRPAAVAALALLRALLQLCPRCRALALASCGALSQGVGSAQGLDGRHAEAASPTASAAANGGGHVQGLGQGLALADLVRPRMLSDRVTLIGPGASVAAPAPVATGPAGHHDGVLPGGKAALRRCCISLLSDLEASVGIRVGIRKSDFFEQKYNAVEHARVWGGNLQTCGRVPVRSEQPGPVRYRLA